MQFKLVVVLMAMCAYQGLNVSTTRVESYETRLLGDLIRELEKVVNAAVDLAFNAMLIALNEVIAISEDVIEGTMIIINKTIQKVVDELQFLKGTAAEVGVDILECTVEPDKILTDLPNVVLKELKKCINNLTAKANEIYLDARKKIKKHVEEMEEIADKADDCDNFICEALLAPEIIAATVKLPLVIAAVSASEVPKIVKVGTDLAGCGIGIADKVTRYTAGILYEAAECISKKIEEAKTSSTESTTDTDPTTESTTDTDPTTESTTDTDHTTESPTTERPTEPTTDRPTEPPTDPTIGQPRAQLIH